MIEPHLEMCAPRFEGITFSKCLPQTDTRADSRTRLHRVLAYWDFDGDTAGRWMSGSAIPTTTENTRRGTDAIRRNLRPSDNDFEIIKDQILPP